METSNDTEKVRVKNDNSTVSVLLNNLHVSNFNDYRRFGTIDQHLTSEQRESTRHVYSVHRVRSFFFFLTFLQKRFYDTNAAAIKCQIKIHGFTLRLHFFFLLFAYNSTTIINSLIIVPLNETKRILFQK